MSWPNGARRTVKPAIRGLMVLAHGYLSGPKELRPTSVAYPCAGAEIALHPTMVVRLPDGLYRAYRNERLVVAHDWRELARDGRSGTGSLDRRLLGRMADAIEDGLALSESCPLELYDGPHAELVRRVERERPRSFEMPTAHGIRTEDIEFLAHTIVNEIAAGHPEALGLRWIEIGSYVPLCQNDACEADFEPIVRRDPSALVWHVAGSLFTWAHSGVWTPPILAGTLHRWAVAMPCLDRWCRAQQDVGDPYVRFMAAYATRLLDGQATRHDDAWLRRYFQLVA